MGIDIQNGLIREIRSDPVGYQDQVTYLLAKLSNQFPNFKFKVAMSGWIEDGKITTLTYYIFASDHPTWFSVFDENSIESAYFRILEKLDGFDRAEIVDTKEEKYEGGLF